MGTTKFRCGIFATLYSFSPPSVLAGELSWSKALGIAPRYADGAAATCISMHEMTDGTLSRKARKGPKADKQTGLSCQRPHLSLGSKVSNFQQQKQNIKYTYIVSFYEECTWVVHSCAKVFTRHCDKSFYDPPPPGGIWVAPYLRMGGELDPGTRPILFLV